MQICAVVVTSYTRQHLIQGAIQSVPWADFILLVHITNTEATPDATLAIARATCGNRLRVVEAGEAHSMSEARNLGLAEAANLGADWAVELDTNKPIIWNLTDIPATLAGVPASGKVIEIYDEAHAYHKPVFFHLPVEGKFHGWSHEDWRPSEGSGLIADGVVFREIHKHPDVIRDGLKPLLAAVERDIEDEPDNLRWRHYREDCISRMRAFGMETP